jgi:glycogen synthase
LRILVVSNLYPPHHLGGYELGCRDVVEGLKARGHEVAVLTSDYSVSGPPQTGSQEQATPGTQDERILRRLRLTAPIPGTPGGQVPFGMLPEVERHNQRVFQDACATYRPQVVYFWNMALVSISLVFLARQASLPINFYVSEHWLSRWENDAWYSRTTPDYRYTPNKLRARLLKMTLRVAALARSIYIPASSEGPDLSHVQFCSQFLKDAAIEAGKPAQNGRVIHWGIESEAFPAVERNRPPVRLLYVGRVSPDKGVHTAVEAVCLLVHRHGHKNVTLTVAGRASDSDYMRRLEALAADGGVKDNVVFAGQFAREQLPGIYQTHDVLVFPSIWEEPFGITPLEAMCSGLAVVGTTTGGSREIFREGVNALTFPREDAAQCATQIARLQSDPLLLAAIRQNAITTVQQQFTMRGMVSQIEQALLLSMEAQPI